MIFCSIEIKNYVNTSTEAGKEDSDDEEDDDGKLEDNRFSSFGNPEQGLVLKDFSRSPIHKN